MSLSAWSPDGKQIAFVGYRWPPPNHPHRVAGQILRAICVADADGMDAEPLPHTTCSERCAQDLIDEPTQLAWVRPDLLVYADDFRMFLIAPGRKPRLFPSAASGGGPFALDAKGDRLAAGCVGDPHSSQPVSVADIPTGRTTSVGGTTYDNCDPSLSPDGTHVVFDRLAQGGGEWIEPAGIWTAGVDGGHPRQLATTGLRPLWSPAGGKIAYTDGKGGLEVVSPRGGASTTLLRHGVGSAFGWSPNGRQIAFEGLSGMLSVVDVPTGKVRVLLRQRYALAAAWSPNSSRLLVTGSTPPPHCGFVWSVPADGAKPRLLQRHC